MESSRFEGKVSFLKFGCETGELSNSIWNSFAEEKIYSLHMSSLGNKREGTLLQERMRGSENGKSNRLQFSDHPSSRGGSEIFRVLLQNDKTLFLMSRRQLIYLALKMRPSPFSRFPPRLNFPPFFKMILIQMIPPSIFEVKIE